MTSLETVRNDEKSRMFLKALEEYGSLSTSELREKTGLSQDELTYQFTKLDSCDLIEIEKDKDLTAEGLPAMKVAELTSRGDELVSKGLTGDVVLEEDYEKSLEELREEFDNFMTEWESFQDWANDVEDRLEKIEEEVEREEDNFDW